MAVINSGLIKRINPIPADLIATNSKLSPRLPKVMIDDNKIASGNASGTSVALKYITNLNIVNVSMPFPTKSSIHNQKNCKINTNSVRKKVAINGPRKALRTSMSSFLINFRF